MGKGKSGDSEGRTPPWSILALRLLWLVFVGVLLFVFWNRLLDTLGMGTFFLVLAVVGLSVAFWQRRLNILWERRNLWLGVTAFIVAVLGILAFFKPEDWPNSLGGTWGLAVTGNPQSDWRTALGVLRVVGVLMIGWAFLAPDFARREAGNWTMRT